MTSKPLISSNADLPSISMQRVILFVWCKSNQPKVPTPQTIIWWRVYSDLDKKTNIAVSEFNLVSEEVKELELEIETIQKRIACCEKKDFSSGYYDKKQHCLCASYRYCGR